MALTRMQHGLFSDDAFTLDEVHRAAPIGNAPVPRPELHRVVRMVFYADMIDPEPLARLYPRLFGQEIHRDPHGDAVCHGVVLEKLFHGLSKLAANGQRDNCPCGQNRHPETSRESDLTI